MRIAQIATVDTPVRRDDSASVEGVVWLLTRELVSLGHEVTVFAAEGSDIAGELVASPPSNDWPTREWVNLCAAIAQSERFDVIHSHAYLWGIPLEPLSRAPMVHTLHVWPYEEDASVWSTSPDACVTAISDSQWSEFPDLRPAATVHHGLDSTHFTFRAEPEDYVCFLGRLTLGKGPVQAIQAARKLGLRLLLAGHGDDYYRDHVAPLVDGRSVEYVGYVTGAERDRLLGGARALLYPVQAPEPFGLVPIEAMMCGTPVAAIRLGAVPEILDEDVTGCSVGPDEDFGDAVLRALELDRHAVRERVELRFSAQAMAAQYAAVYERLAAQNGSGARKQHG